MGTSKKTKKTKKTNKDDKRRQRVHKRLVVNGAKLESFQNGFGRLPKTVFPENPYPTAVLPLNQHPRPSHSASGPEDFTHPSDTPVISGFGQYAHANQYQGQTSDAQSAINFQSAQSSYSPPMIHTGVHSTGQATTLAFPVVLPARNPYWSNSNTFQPRNTESDFDSFDGGRMSRMHPDGQPLRSPWLEAPFNTSYGIGFTEHGHQVGAQHNVTAQGYLPGNQLHQTHRTPFHGPGAQHFNPFMYNTPDHIDLSVVGGSHLPPPHSTGSGYDGYYDTTTD